MKKYTKGDLKKDVQNILLLLIVIIIGTLYISYINNTYNL